MEERIFYQNYGVFIYCRHRASEPTNFSKNILVKMAGQDVHKILFLDQYSSMGGAQTILLELIQSAAQKSDQIGVCIPMGGNLESALGGLSIKQVKKYPALECHLTVGKKTTWDILKMFLFTIY